jgi:serine-type D-Ala-D-Ala carboxypeptidase/endopeptidase (penicillin-binding protein 4)
MNERLDDPAFDESLWGVLLESLETGEIWYERNADRLFVPASNQKILTAAAAYRALGPDFVFSTTVHHTGRIFGETLQGDLVVWGNGDPTLYNRFHSDPRDVFRKWARDLRERGITRITGNIVGDDSAWEDKHVGSGWPQDEITPWYYAEFGPLQFNENYVDLRFIPPAEVGGELRIQPNVESGYFTLINEVRVVASGSNNVSMNRPMHSNVITLSGTVVAGSQPFERTPTITNPTLFYVTALKETLEAEGIRVEGEPVDIDDLADWPHETGSLPLLATHESPPLSRIVPAFMKRSQNMYGETLVYAMGWHETGEGTFAAGREVVRRELSTFGIDRERFRFSDGSGLSRYNHISPRMIVAINRGMVESEFRELWLESQAVAGQDGTLRNLRNETLQGADLRAKTGTLFAVRSLSGFLTTAGGERLLFSVINNGSLRGSRAVDAVVHDVLEMVAEFQGEPAVAAGR